MGLGADSVLDGIVHSEMHGALSKLYPTAVTIQAATITQRPNGEQVEAWATFLGGLTGNLARPAQAKMERRGGTMTTATAEWSLNLSGYYPTITVEHRVLIGEVAYNIAAAVHDSMGASTRLELERTVH